MAALWIALLFALALGQETEDPISGLPYVWSVVPRDALQSDISNRTCRNITDEQWCVFDQEMRDWCGPNPRGAVYSYCIFTVDDSWPPADPNWMDNATFAPVGFVYLPRPAFCACNNSGRAYWVDIPGPGRSTYITPRFAYQPPCSGEHALLAMYTLEILCFGLCCIWAVLEIALWLTLFLTKAKTFNFASAFLPKVSAALFCGCCVILLVFQVINIYGNFDLVFVLTWFRMLAFIFLTLTYIFWLAIFTDVTQKIRSLSASASNKLAVFCLWTIFPLILLILAGLLATMGAAYHYGRLFINDQNYFNKIHWNDILNGLTKANSTLAVIGAFIVCVWGTGLSIKSGYDIAYVSEDGGLGENFDIYKKKAWYNFFATLCYWPLFILQTLFLPLTQYNVYNWSEYQVTYCYGWLLACQAFFGIGLIVSLLLALQTQLTKKNYLSQIVSVISTANSNASSENKSGGPPSRRKSSVARTTSGAVNKPTPD